MLEGALPKNSLLRMKYDICPKSDPKFQNRLNMALGTQC
jgi:hypothetical protein